MSDDIIEFTYLFSLDDGQNLKYILQLDKKKKIMLNPPNVPEEFDYWVKLSFNKCENCPLNEEENPVCPVARNIIGMVTTFQDNISYEKTSVAVQTSQRSYYKKTDLQNGLMSMFGLMMATSGCPHFHFLAPMAVFHLPFASTDETLVRAMSFFLLREYLTNPDKPIDLDKLQTAYDEIDTVNHGIIKRIRSLNPGDAEQNAITILDTFTQIFSIEYQMGMETLKEIFGIES